MKPSQAFTQLCAYDETQIFVRDQNLCEDLIGKVSFTRYLFFLTLGRFPSQAEETIVDRFRINARTDPRRFQSGN